MGKWIDVLYDVLTVIISIADITTDVIILFSFYSQQRQIFFIISLVIMIISHIAYTLAFIVRYNVVTKCKWCTILFFFVSIPFASLYSFLFLFTEDTDSYFTKVFETVTRLDASDGFQSLFGSYGKRSKLIEWTIDKLSKHMGFILEAGLEALPQSLLQIIAIVYYEEANYVSIISIFLSMFSVMTKSLVFSRGIDIKTYIWTWFCIVVDFFGIFFTLTWVFYTNDNLLKPVFWGYFSVIGQIWCYKVMIGIVPVVIVGILLWFTYGIGKSFVKCNIVCKDYDSGLDVCCKVFFGLSVVICGSIGVILLTPVGFIALETFLFAFIAYGIYAQSTSRWENHDTKQVNNLINEMLEVISSTKNDRIMRILSFNYFAFNNQSSYRKGQIKIQRYIDKIDCEQGIVGLRKIKYKDIRNNCGSHSYPGVKRRANVFPQLWYLLKDEAPDCIDWTDCLCCRGHNFDTNIEYCFDYVVFYILFVLFAPPFVVCKIFQMVFPYIIIGYVTYYHGWSDIDIFQYVMLFTYVGLQIVLFIFSIFVMRVHLWMHHILPGILTVTFSDDDIVIKANEWYVQRAYGPLIQELIIEIYGDDIARIIMDFYHNIQLNEQTVKDSEI